MRFWREGVPVVVVLLLARGLTPSTQAKDKDGAAAVIASTKFATLQIPRLEQRPTLADFLNMQPSPALAGKMLKVDGFQQRDPKDGAPISQKTEVYLGYTDKNLYVVCVCYDSEPDKIRARLVRRELINDDDQFGFVIDTFSDHAHGLFFYVNPLGVQQDGIWDDAGQDPDYLLRHGVELRGQADGDGLRRVVRDSLQIDAFPPGRHPEVGSVLRARH